MKAERAARMQEGVTRKSPTLNGEGTATKGILTLTLKERFYIHSPKRHRSTREKMGAVSLFRKDRKNHERCDHEQ